LPTRRAPESREKGPSKGRQAKPGTRVTIDSAGIRRLASLSKLVLTSQEEERLKAELSSVLDYFAALDGVDVAGVLPAYALRKGQRSVRADIPSPSRAAPDEILALVPQLKGRYVKAPKVF
jgi:aspartyl/glutamyl-tRNA(Asn/Gln) amidotransferase C subunit